MTTPFEKIVSRLPKVRRRGAKRATAPCPAHGGTGFNLSVKEFDTGDAWPKCFSMGCSTKEIMEAIGLELKDGYANNGNGGRFGSNAERTAFFKENSLSTVAEKVIAYESPAIGRKLSEIEEEPITWLWEPFIPLGMYTLVDGEEGIGKTFVMLAVAAAVTSGQGLYGISEECHIAPGNVLLFAAEDSAAQVIKPRLRAMGADMERVIVVEEPISLNTPAGIIEFEKAMQFHNPRLCIFDPIFACVGGIDLNQDNHVRLVTSQLKRFAEQFNCAVVGVRHIGKSKGMGDVRNAGLGGVGWRASSRSNLLIGKNPENDRERAIVQTKTNLLPERPQAIGYTIDPQHGFCWTGPSSLTAATMLTAKMQETHVERSEREEAKALLREILSGGPLAQKEVMKAAREAGISESTIRRAKYDIGLQVRKNGLGPWEWSLK